jgi:uncharacterized membrane protein YdjX (TVP38/TMEM64 family)
VSLELQLIVSYFTAMKKYILIVSVLFTILIILFLVAELLHVPFLADDSIKRLAGFHLCWIGALLLAIDVLLPVPSSLVMVTLGCVAGVFWGTLWAFLGVFAAAIIGFSLGRTAQPFVKRFVGEEERNRVNAFIKRWGMAGIIVTRPLPLLAETTVLIAGTTNLSWKNLLIASLCGNLPIALFYAWTGATAKTINSGLWSFLLVIGAATLFWLVNYFIARVQRHSGK